MPRFWNRCINSPPTASPIQLILCKVKQIPVRGKKLYRCQDGTSTAPPLAIAGKSSAPVS